MEECRVTPPNKCEAVRRAIINVDNLADLAALSSETTILFREFNHARWCWNVVVSHDVLPSLAPNQMCMQYGSVAIFNRMIEQQLAKAIAGELAAEADPLTSYGMQLQLQLQQQAAQAQFLGQTRPTYTSGSSQAAPTWGSTGGLGQTLGGWNTTGSTTP